MGAARERRAPSTFNVSRRQLTRERTQNRHYRSRTNVSGLNQLNDAHGERPSTVRREITTGRDIGAARAKRCAVPHGPGLTGTLGCTGISTRNKQ